MQLQQYLASIDMLTATTTGLRPRQLQLASQQPKLLGGQHCERVGSGLAGATISNQSRLIVSQLATKILRIPLSVALINDHGMSTGSHPVPAR
jgi:hypothetical protein